MLCWCGSINVKLGLTMVMFAGLTELIAKAWHA